MKIFSFPQWIDVMDALSLRQQPFFFFINYDKSEAIIQSLTEIDDQIKYKINAIRRGTELNPTNHKKLRFNVSAIEELTYQIGFNCVQKHLQYGDSFLTNLTYPSHVEMNYSLEEVFYAAHAKYKFLWRDKMVIFSPECFVKIDGDTIRTHPMKGTIDAKLPNAVDALINNEKELSEHFTIVDLLRNDLSQVADQVTVPRFRYVESIQTHKGSLLATSSEITGSIHSTLRSKIGSIFDRLLPAGSITGAPKQKTIQIIEEAEIDARGYYTGVFGIFDGKDVDSAVAIRFIEKKANGEYFFRSGGGITAYSNCIHEYQELKSKIYVPIFRKHLD